MSLQSAFTRTISIILALAALEAQLPAEEPAPKDNPKACKKEAPSLFDGKTLAGWKIAKKNSYESHGEVKVQTNQIDLAAGKPATGIVRTDAPPKINYEISLEAMRTKGSDFFCGLTFPIQDQHCTLILGGWGGGVVGLSNLNGYSADENEATTYQEFKNNQWYRIRLRVTEAKLQVWIDDKAMIDIKTGDHKYDIWWEQEPMKPLGIATWNTSAALRSLELKKVEEADDNKKPSEKDSPKK